MNGVLPDHVVIVPQHFGGIVFLRPEGRYLPFDAPATAFLARLAEVPVAQALAEASSPAQQRAQLALYERFYPLGLFRWDGRLAGSVLPRAPTTDHLVGPLTVHLELTGECNLACRHCFASSPARPDGLPLSLVELEVLFAELASLGSFRLGLTGGEPLLRPDLLEIIDAALACGLDPCLTTNGLPLTPALATELGRRRLGWLNVSLEGATAATHDVVRGLGTFQRVMERLVWLRERTRFSLAFTVTRANLSELRACAELARRVGAAAAVFRPLYPVGRGAARPELLLDLATYREALAGLARPAASDPVAWQFCSQHPWGPQSRQATQARVTQGFGCGAGHTVCSISASGTVSPCSFLGPAYAAGELRQETFGEIWSKSAVFRELRGLVGDPRCRGCSHFAVCGGGCRARAQAAGRGPEGADPWCMAE